MTELHLDFKIICRICLVKCENMQSLFDSDTPKHLLECANIQVQPNDGLPQLLCVECVSSLQQFYNFKKKIEISDQTLRTYSSKEKLFYNTTRKHCDYEDDNKVFDIVKCENTQKIEYSLKQKHQRSLKDPKINAALMKLLESAPNTLENGQKNCQKCHICEKIFSCKGQLTRHFKTHIGIRSHKCDICGNAYMESGALRKHFLSKHSGREKPYKCIECEQGFDVKSSLDKHIRTHTGEKPFGCELCRKCFHSKSYLNKHKMV